MLRAIIRRQYKDQYTGLESEGFETLDFHSEALEEVLGGGGYSELGYDYRSLVGIEIVDSTGDGND